MTTTTFAEGQEQVLMTIVGAYGPMTVNLAQFLRFEPSITCGNC